MNKFNLKKPINILLFTLLSLILLISKPAYCAEIKFFDQLESKGYLRVGLPNYNTAPFYYLDDKNKLTGYDVDIARRFAEKLNLKVVFDQSSKNFDDLVRRAGANEVDLAIGKLGTTYDRMKDAHPHEYMNFRHALLMKRLKRSSLQGNTPNDKFAQVLLSSKFKIGFISNSVFETYANSLFPNATKVGYKSWGEATKALLKNDIDAIYRDATEIKMIVYQTPALSVDYVPILIDDLIDQKSIYVSSKINSEMGSVLDYFLSKEIKIKTDTEIMEEFQSFYNPINK